MRSPARWTCSLLDFRHERRRLEVAEQRLVAALRVPVVGDDEQVVPVEAELAGEWLAARAERATRRVDPAHLGQLGDDRAAASVCRQEAPDANS
jgi:hypothetical protein